MTPLPEAETPDFCNESLPLVDLNLLVANPSAASWTNVSPSSPFVPPAKVAVGVDTFNLTLSSLPPFPLADVDGVDVDAIPLVIALGPGVEDWRDFDFGLPRALCSASGKVVDTGGAKMDRAPVVSGPEGAGLGPASLPRLSANGESALEGESPCGPNLAMLYVSVHGHNHSHGDV